MTSKFGMTNLDGFDDLDVANKPKAEPKKRMKTTAVLDKDTWKQLKILAAEEEVALNDLLQEGAELVLKSRKS